jgi:hypothetical protein
MKLSQQSKTSLANMYRLIDFGYDPEEARTGCFGLKRRRQRTGLPRGRDAAESVPGHATRIAVGLPAERQLPLEWSFDPWTPTCDFFEDQDLDDAEDLQDAVGNFISWMKRGGFLAWEAVVAHEHGLPLTRRQQAALDDLIDLNHSRSERVLYINGLPRTAEPWYAVLNKIVPRLLVEPFTSLDPPPREHCEGWRLLVECLNEHADGLSLPMGVTSAVEVVPVQLRHKLWLQDCFEFLCGLAREKQLTLQSEAQHYRIEDLVESLREHRDTVRYFDLTLDSLLARLMMPQTDRPIFMQAVQEKLRMKSAAGRIVDYL